MQQYMFVHHHNNRELFDLILSTLEKAGYRVTEDDRKSFWNPGVNDSAIAFFHPNSDNIVYFSSGGEGWYKRREQEGENYKGMTLEEFFKIFSKPLFKEVKLNQNYKAQVFPDGNVKVGCQTFSIGTIQTVLDAHKELNS